MTAACPSSLGADLSRRRTSGPLVLPNGKGPEAMAQQVRAERVPDEAGSPRELRAYLPDCRCSVTILRNPFRGRYESKARYSPPRSGVATDRQGVSTIGDSNRTTRLNSVLL